MHIVVCVKQVPDSAQIRVHPVTNRIMRQGVPAIINPFDLFALEEALRIKDRTGARVTVIELRADLAGDLHVHTNWSDGTASIEAMATAARAQLARIYASLGPLYEPEGRAAGYWGFRVYTQGNQPFTADTVKVSGAVAHDAAVAGAPILNGGYAANAEPTAVSNGDVARLLTDLVGLMDDYELKIIGAHKGVILHSMREVVARLGDDRLSEIVPENVDALVLAADVPRVPDDLLAAEVREREEREGRRLVLPCARRRGEPLDPRRETRVDEQRLFARHRMRAHDRMQRSWPFGQPLAQFRVAERAAMHMLGLVPGLEP